MRAMKVPDRVGHGRRAVFAQPLQHEEDVDHCLSVLPGVIGKLRAVLRVAV
jgi:hypothetical protein